MSEDTVLTTLLIIIAVANTVSLVLAILNLRGRR